MGESAQAAGTDGDLHADAAHLRKLAGLSQPATLFCSPHLWVVNALDSMHALMRALSRRGHLCLCSTHAGEHKEEVLTHAQEAWKHAKFAMHMSTELPAYRKRPFQVGVEAGRGVAHPLISHT